MKKQCIVIGLGRFGSSVAKTLSSLGNEVLAIDVVEDNVKKIKDHVTHAIVCDIKDELAVESLGINSFDVAIVGIGEDVESNCMAILALKEHNVKHIITKAKSPDTGKILSAVGANKVVYPERDMGIRVARNLYSSDLFESIELSEESSIAEIPTPKWCIGKSLEKLKIRERFKLNVVAIKNQIQTNASLTPNTTIYSDDILIVIGKNIDIHRFEQSL